MRSLSGLMTLQRSVLKRPTKLRLVAIYPSSALTLISGRMDTPNSHIMSRSLCTQLNLLIPPIREADLHFIDQFAMRGDMRSMMKVMVKEVIKRDGHAHVAFNRLVSVMCHSGLYDSASSFLSEVVRIGIYEQTFGARFEEQLLQVADIIAATEMLKIMINLNIRPRKATLEKVCEALSVKGYSEELADLMITLVGRRFVALESMYRSLFNIHMEKSNYKAAYSLYLFWDEKIGLKIDMNVCETLIEALVRNDFYSEALQVLQTAKQNGIRQCDLELRFLLKLDIIDSILPVVRDAALLDYSITENVGILVAKKYFELAQIEENKISELKYEIKNRAVRKESSEIERGNVLPNEGETLDTLLLESTNKLKKIIDDIEEMSSSIVNQDRGGVGSFSRIIRLWRVGGSAHRDRIEMALINMVKFGVDPRTENYREILGINENRLYNFSRKSSGGMMNTKKVPFQDVLDYLKGKDVTEQNSSVLPLNEINTDAYICERLKVMNENNELNTLVNFQSAIFCLSDTKNPELLLEIFQKNIVEVVKNSQKMIEYFDNKKIINDVAVKVVKSWQKKITTRGLQSSENSKLNIIVIPDVAIQTMWSKLLGEFSYNCYRQKSNKKITKKCDELLNLYFHPDTVQLANFHKTLIAYTARTNTSEGPRTDQIINSSITNTQKVPTLRPNFTKLPETKFEKSVFAILHIPKNLFWCGVPYSVHYNLVLQACKNAESILDSHFLVRLMRYNVRNNKEKLYSSPNYKSILIYPANVGKLDSRTYQYFIDSMLINREREKKQEKKLNPHIRSKNQGISSKNENEIILLALEFANKINSLSAETSGSTEIINEKELWDKNHTNMSIINVLEKGFELAVRDATYAALPHDENGNLPSTNSPTISNNEYPMNSVNENLQVRDHLKRAVSIFNAITLCDFPQSESSYRALLKVFLRIAGVAKGENNNTNNKLEINKIEINKIYNGKIENDNGIDIGEMNKNAIDSTENEDKEEEEEEEEDDPRELRPELSENDRMEHLEMAVDLFEGMMVTHKACRRSLIRDLLSAVISTGNMELLARLCTSSPPSFLLRTPFSQNLTTIINCLFELEKYDKLVFYSVAFSGASRARIRDEFSNIKNWKKIIISILKLKQNESEFKSLYGYNFDRYNDLRNFDKLDSRNKFPIRQKVDHNFLSFLDRKLGLEKLVPNKENLELSEVDQLFYTIVENCSNLRVFVDNSKLVLEIVNFLVEKNSPIYAISLLKVALADCKFTSPKNKYDTIDVEGKAVPTPHPKEIFENTLRDLENTYFPKFESKKWVKNKL